MENREQYQECDGCAGHGWVIADYQHPQRITPKEVICDVCAGTGKVEEETILEITGNIIDLAKEVQGGEDCPFRQLAEKAARVQNILSNIK